MDSTLTADEDVRRKDIYLEKEQVVDGWTRQIGGAVIAYADGAVVSDVSLPSDFSAVQLSNLPAQSPVVSAKTLLSDLGLDVSALDLKIRVTSLHGDDGCSATVTARDPTFAHALTEKLRLSTRAPKVTAVPTPVPMARGSGAHRVDCRTVHCSWFKPSRTAWLNFGTRDIARKVHERFQSGVYTVPGTKVNAEAQTGHFQYGNPMAWTVKLTNLNSEVTALQIEQAIASYHKPRHIELGKPSYKCDVGLMSSTVKSMLLEIGPLEWWEMSHSPQAKRFKAQARFFDDYQAEEAVSKLNNASLSFSSSAKLTVAPAIVARYKVPTQIYNVLGDRLGSLKPMFENSQVRFVAYPPQGAFRTLKLEGADREPVGKAKKNLDKILEGEVMKHNECDLWSKGFEQDRNGLKRLKEQVEERYGVVVMRDGRRSQLRVWGPEESCKEATVAVQKVLLQMSQNSGVFVIEPDKIQVKWALHGGFKLLLGKLGEHKATLDIVSTPKRILISGTELDHQTALAVIAAGETSILRPLEPSAEDCSVCFTEAEEPIRTSCKHVYCTDCFINLCESQSRTSLNFRVSCVGHMATCNKSLSLSEIQEHLSSAAFEKLLEESFASYVGCHPAHLRYCSTPDCGQIYRTAGAKAFTCTLCLSQTCTACHQSHPGMTCAEHKYQTSGDDKAFEQYKEKAGVKDCPQCKTPIQKSEGCHHMTCSSCRIHFCWLCRAKFDTGDDCYRHLNKTHGGVFDLPNFG